MISKKQLPLLISHIEAERSRCGPAHDALLKDITTWYKLFEMDNKKLKRNIPFQGASHAVQPLIFEETKLLYGKLWAMQFRHRPLLAATPTAFEPQQDIIEATQNIQHSLDHLMYNEVEVRRKTMPITLEGLLCGAGVAYIPFLHERKLLPVRIPGKEEAELMPQTTYFNADLQHTPLAHCWWPPEAPSLERTRWFSRDLWISPDELVEMAQSEDVDKENVFKIISGGTDNPSSWAQSLGDMINMPMDNSPNHKVVDWWGWYRDPEQKQLPCMYNVLYHPGTRLSILSRVNPFDDHSYPFAIWNYFPRPNKILGIGIGRLLTDMNDSLNEIWNQRVNAGRIANTKVFKVRKGSGLKPSDKIYPGKRLYLTNPATDVMEMDFGDVKPSAYADEKDIWAIADRVSSTGESQRGNQTISRPNASGQLALLEIAEENISIIGDNLRIFWSRVGRLIYSRTRQFHPSTKLLPKMEESEAVIILEALGSKRITFDLAAADERMNPEAERQKLSTAYQMFTGYYETLLQYGQIISNPQVPPLLQTIALKASLALTQFMKRIGRNLNLKGFEQFLVEDFDATASQPGVPSLPTNTNQGAAGGQSGVPPPSADGNLGTGDIYPRAIAR